MNHHREGSGEPLVLIHGVGHHWQGFQAVIPDLARDFDVIATDSPGFGESAALRHAGPPTIPTYVDAFEQWFHDQGLDRPHVAGNSMGGAIALELAKRGAVRSATALSPAGFWNAAELRYATVILKTIANTPKPLRPGVRAALRTAAGRKAILGVLIRWPERLAADDAIATTEAAWAAPSFNAAIDAFHHYRYASPSTPIDVPTTVAWGNRDLLLPYWSQAPRARTLVPEATHVTLGAGHLPMTDDPRAVATAIRSTARRAPTD